jgi:dTDP-4-dehydrorhamnose reductase
VQQQPGLGGLYHLVAGGETSWHGYARHVIEWARRHGQALRVPPEQVLPIATREYPTPATRPLNSRLDTTRLQTAFGLRLPHWQAGVDRMLAEVLPS